MPLAKAMIDAAADAGADAIKLQFYQATPAFLSQYKDPAARRVVAQSEFRFFALRACAKHAKNQGLNFICTPFGVQEAVTLIEKFGGNWRLLDYIKVRAKDCTNGELLDYIGNYTQQDALISVPSTIPHDPRQLIRDTYFAGDPSRAAFLYCVPFYPPTPAQMHLENISLGKFEGFSDHNPNIEAALAAIAYGAKIIEKHVYLDMYDGFLNWEHEPVDPRLVCESRITRWLTKQGDEIPCPLDCIDRPVSVSFSQLKQLIQLGRKLEVECFGKQRRQRKQ